MTEGTGKSHSVGGRCVEPLPRGARKHAFPPSPRPLVVLGLACGARPMSENVQPQGFWKIGSRSIWGRRVGVARAGM